MKKNIQQALRGQRAAQIKLDDELRKTKKGDPEYIALQLKLVSAYSILETLNWVLGLLDGESIQNKDGKKEVAVKVGTGKGGLNG